ncbi:hypothetical protein Scep_018938 [Stephania cephalantha]|uniref:Uncharacterized protein n=1 Tax=Stephania cephalantha TaxID=152367 RepID=A0AAP0I9Y4_9MAGN
MIKKGRESDIPRMSGCFAKYLRNPGLNFWDPLVILRKWTSRQKYLDSESNSPARDFLRRERERRKGEEEEKKLCAWKESEEITIEPWLLTEFQVSKVSYLRSISGVLLMWTRIAKRVNTYFDAAS